jgi:MFS family permease
MSTATSLHGSASATSKPRRDEVIKVAAASFVGTYIEWYDYFIFGAAAALIFPKLIFAGMPPAVATIVSLGTIGVTFITRPVGAVIFGHFGDTLGRKNMLVLSLMIMGAATFLIGLLPTYQSIGVASPILLITIRLLQGVAVGGEWGGATTMIIEYAPENRRGLFGTFVQLGNVTGLLTSTAAFALASSLNETAFMTWGWRVPFLVSVVLLAVGMFIRLRLQEPPAFRRLLEAKKSVALPVAKVLQQYPKEIVVVFAMRLSETVLGYLIMGWLLAYITGKLGLPRQIGLTGLILATASGVITFPLFGWLSDIWGRRPVYLFGCVGACVFAFPMLWMVDSGSTLGIWLAMIIGYGTVLAAQYALEPAYYAELFDTDVRYTGVSLGAQLASIAGGFTPAIAAIFVAWGGGATWPVALFLFIASALTTLGVLAAGETFKRDIVQARQDNS